MVANMEKYKYKYAVIGLFSYGYIRSMLKLWDADVRVTHDNQMKPMLLGDKIAAFTGSLFLTPFLAPFWVINDVNRIDLYFRGGSISEYGLQRKPSTILQHIKA
jgi:hypothetical protein